jgi:hypothetical protein
MNKARLVLFGSVIAVAMVFGGVMGATVFAHSSGLTPALAALAAASPTPSFKSNEDPAHEKNESAAQEQAENNGTFRPGGPGVGGHPCGGHSNEDATHEKSETAAQEASENAACPTPPANATSGG